MSLDKAIKYGKEKRKPYYGSQACDWTCRPHGTCDWCRGNRLHSRIKRDEASKQALKEIEDD